MCNADFSIRGTETKSVSHKGKTHKNQLQKQCSTTSCVSQEISSIYKKAGYDSIIVSAIQKTGIDILYSKLRGAVISFSGPSGVGKSSLLNLLIGKEYFNCQEVSSQTGRGKNTTRHSELIKLTNTNYLMDTPGYTALDLNADLADGLDFLFREFRPYLGKCKFNNCYT